jgi:transcription elongation GreA/GreB family factor
LNRRKAQLVAQLRERRAKLDATFEELDARVTELGQLPAKIRDDVVKVGRWTAIVIAVTAVTLVSVLVARALIGSRAGRRRRW